MIVKQSLIFLACTLSVPLIVFVARLFRSRQVKAGSLRVPGLVWALFVLAAYILVMPIGFVLSAFGIIRWTWPFTYVDAITILLALAVLLFVKMPHRRTPGA